MSNNFVIKVSREGVPVENATVKQTAFSTEFDSLKVAYSGTLTVSLPSETITGTNTVRTATYGHGLGYIPIFLPLYSTVSIDYTDPADQIYNDIVESDLLEVGSFGSAGEQANIYVDDTNFTLSVNRFDIGVGTLFEAHDVTVYFTILYNELNEEMDLL